MKKFMKIMPIVLLVAVISTSVFGIEPSLPSGGSEITSVTGVATNLWATAAVIIQILAIAAIVLAGVRYMFASAESKSDIKQQTVVLVLGAILVFAAVPLAGFIASLGEQLFPAS